MFDIIWFIAEAKYAIQNFLLELAVFIKIRRSIIFLKRENFYNVCEKRQWSRFASRVKTTKPTQKKFVICLAKMNSKISIIYTIINTSSCNITTEGYSRFVLHCNKYVSEINKKPICI